MTVPKDQSEECSITGLKPGDIITAYRAGTHKVIAIERRFLYECDLIGEHKNKKVGDEYFPLIHYQCILNSNGSVTKSKRTFQCDASYCHKITAESIAAEHKEAAEQADKKRDAMLDLLGDKK